MIDPADELTKLTEELGLYSTYFPIVQQQLIPSSGDTFRSGGQTYEMGKRPKLSVPKPFNSQASEMKKCKKHQHYAYCTDCGERFSIPKGFFLVDRKAMNILNKWARKNGR